MLSRLSWEFTEQLSSAVSLRIRLFLPNAIARRTYFDVNLKYATASGSLAQANATIDGLLLSGGLSNFVTWETSDDLPGQALSGR